MSGVFAAKRPGAKKTQTDRPDRCRGPLPRRSQTDSIQRQSGLDCLPLIDIKRQKEVLQRILIDVMGFRGVGITVDSTVANLSGGA
jgi:hypothetical protein